MTLSITFIHDMALSVQIVFNYVNDKDTFQLFYRKFLVKRLIYETGASSEYEEFMIRKLQVIDLCFYSLMTTLLFRKPVDMNTQQKFNACSKIS